jgi:hypothetical protein
MKITNMLTFIQYCVILFTNLNDCLKPLNSYLILLNFDYHHKVSHWLSFQICGKTENWACLSTKWTINSHHSHLFMLIEQKWCFSLQPNLYSYCLNCYSLKAKTSVITSFHFISYRLKSDITISYLWPLKFNCTKYLITEMTTIFVITKL